MFDLGRYGLRRNNRSRPAWCARCRHVELRGATGVARNGELGRLAVVLGSIRRAHRWDGRLCGERHAWSTATACRAVRGSYGRLYHRRLRGGARRGEPASRRPRKGRLAYRDVGRDVVDRTADRQRNVSLRASPVTRTERDVPLGGAATDLVRRDRQGNAITLYVRTAATCAAVGMKPPPPFPVNLSALYIELRVWEGVAAVPVAMV